MKTALVMALSLAGMAAAQLNAPPAVVSKSAPGPKHTRPSAKHDVGTGAGDVGKGTVKATGSTALDLVTLHPINAATDVGKGTAGAVKGTGKILRGTGKAFRHLF